MANNKNSEHLHFRYGICSNDNCSRGKAKEIQQVFSRRDFVCSECGGPLNECPPPKSWWDKNGKWVIIALIVLLVGGLGGYFWLNNNDKKKDPVVELPQNARDSIKVESKTTDSLEQQPKVQDNVQEDSVKLELKEEIKDEEEKEEKTVVKPKNPKHGTVNLGYGVYTGDLKNGKPHGYGKIRYTKQHKIVSSQEYMAFPGDIYEGEFRDGRVSGSFGYWYHDGIQTAIKP